MQRLYGPETVLAEMSYNGGQESKKMKLSDVGVTEKLEKFIEDVKCEPYTGREMRRFDRCVFKIVLTLGVFQERHLPFNGVRNKTATEPVESDDAGKCRIGKVGHARTDGRRNEEDRIDRLRDQRRWR